MRVLRRGLLAGTAGLAAMGGAPARPGTLDDDLDVVRRALGGAHEGFEVAPASRTGPGADQVAEPEPSPAVDEAADEELHVVRRAVREAPAAGRARHTVPAAGQLPAPRARSWLRVQLSERGATGGRLTLRLPLPAPEQSEPARGNGRSQAAHIQALLSVLRAADDDLLRIEDGHGSLRVKIE